MLFEPISLSYQDAYIRHFSVARLTASDYSFINLWGWAEEYGLSWAWDNGLVWIRQEIPMPCLWAPVGDWEGVSWAATFDNPQIQELPFSRVPEELLFQWVANLPGRVKVEEAREHWDYLYSVPELVDLAGNKFHNKKNLLTQFKKKYRFKYQEITPSLLPKVLAMQEVWCTWRDCESIETLARENRVIKRVLQAWEDLTGIMGAVINVEGEPTAFTVAEALKEDMLLVHFEKGLPEFTGIYQAINQMFLEHSNGFSLVNREQDLADEGLRKSKLSYHPSSYVRKYRVRIT